MKFIQKSTLFIVLVLTGFSSCEQEMYETPMNTDGYVIVAKLIAGDLKQSVIVTRGWADEIAIGTSTQKTDRNRNNSEYGKDTVIVYKDSTVYFYKDRVIIGYEHPQVSYFVQAQDYLIFSPSKTLSAKFRCRLVARLRPG